MRVSILSLLAFVLAACGGEAPDEPAAQETPPAESAEQTDPRAPVVVYASYEDGNYWPQFFHAFTEETGIRVNVRTREQSVNVGDVIANRGTPPADVLIVDGVHDLWLASDEGALRPLAIEGIEDLVDSRFLDPDGQWAAIGVSAAMLAYDPDQVDPSDIATYEDLGKEALQGKLCLSSSALPLNRALIAMLIDELGARPAEIAVRHWIRNLVVPPFESEDALLDAMDAGTCGIGIVSSRRAFARMDDDRSPTWAGHLTHTVYANIEGVAVVRHAHEPEKANRLVAWMLDEENQRRHSTAVFTLPVEMPPGRAVFADNPTEIELSRHEVADREVSVAGWRDEEAILLAERARYP